MRLYVAKEDLPESCSVCVLNKGGCVLQSGQNVASAFEACPLVPVEERFFSWNTGKWAVTTSLEALGLSADLLSSLQMSGFLTVKDLVDGIRSKDHWVSKIGIPASEMDEVQQALLRSPVELIAFQGAYHCGHLVAGYVVPDWWGTLTAGLPVIVCPVIARNERRTRVEVPCVSKKLMVERIPKLGLSGKQERLIRASLDMVLVKQYSPVLYEKAAGHSSM